ncbi:hypothetical protein CC78DRAFT_576965 [Lojkania enalia]|uniref:Uncharacterized protein n=1 Tax=Lojkania enalia TaxID=147567 RepID=A0A9P4KFC7_9PLEO|nr:hypothetical protein CC78DRAFT_576965 [Didymosphaeria enalia]
MQVSRGRGTWVSIGDTVLRQPLNLSLGAKGNIDKSSRIERQTGLLSDYETRVRELPSPSICVYDECAARCCIGSRSVLRWQAGRQAGICDISEFFAGLRLADMAVDHDFETSSRQHTHHPTNAERRRRRNMYVQSAPDHHQLAPNLCSTTLLTALQK